MAPVPVAEIGMVTVLPVWNTWRSISHTSSMTWKNTGSRCPTTGWGHGAQDPGVDGARSGAQQKSVRRFEFVSI